MRQLDEQECWALGTTPQAALQSSIDRSTEWFKEEREGELLAFWGYRVDSAILGVAMFWLLSFEGADKHKTYFARRSAAIISEAQDMYPTLRVEVWAGHFVALRWLEWLGFRVVSAMNVNNQVFYTMERCKWAS